MRKNRSPIISTPCSHPFPLLASLPNELVIHILKLAAASSRESCLSLCLVSSWTRDLALPYLFTTVVLKSITEAERFHERLVGKPDCASFVHNLWLDDLDYATQGLHQLKELLRACNRIVNLAVDGIQLSVMYLEDVVFVADGLRLCIHDDCGSHRFWAVPQYPPNLTHISNMITHIHVALDFHYFDSRPYSSIFPRLTHLAHTIQKYLPTLGDFNGILASTTLKVLVLVINRQSIPIAVVQRMALFGLYNELRKQSTGRLQVYIAWTGPGSAREKWLDEVEGRYSIWERAIQDTEEWIENMS